MSKKLYFAPLNRYSNFVYRHLMLKYSCDCVFSELIMINRIKKEEKNQKFKYIKSDIKKTIFQIGVSSKEEIDKAFIEFENRKIPLNELNINMDCPHSGMKNVCGNLLENEKLIENLCDYFSFVCLKKGIIPSVKIRLGTRKDKIRIKKYLDIMQKCNIKKVYIHMRTLRYPYQKPVILKWIKEIDFKRYKIDIILNGDVDSFLSYNRLAKVCDSIMIGRATLINPFIFDDIRKQERKWVKIAGYKEGNKEIVFPDKKDIDIFDPIKHDKNIIIKGQETMINNKKMKFISEFISLAKKEKLREESLYSNLKYLTKGISNSNKKALFNIKK